MGWEFTYILSIDACTKYRRTYQVLVRSRITHYIYHIFLSTCSSGNYEEVIFLDNKTCRNFGQDDRDAFQQADRS